jgi:hypothetical protein
MKITATSNIAYMANSVMQKGQTMSIEQLGNHLARLFESRSLATIDMEENKMITDVPNNKAVIPQNNKSRVKAKSKRKTK